MSDLQKTNWEMGAKALALQCLKEGFALSDFKVSYTASTARIQIYLDKLTDRYGSPTVAECGEFSKRFSHLLETQKVLGLPSNYSIEVSSPGAERQLVGIEQYERFKNLPMKVSYRDVSQKKLVQVLNYLGCEAGITRWQLAKTKFNTRHSLKAKKVSQELPIIEIPQQDILYVNLYVEV